MSRKIFVNLPVANVERTKAFFAGLGFTFNPQFSDEAAACMVVSADIFAMLMTRERFKEFTPLPVSDAAKSTEVLICLSCDSRAQVDDVVAKAVAAGATTFKAPQDHGFMYVHSFQDLDGHIWEWAWMDPAAVQQ